LPPFHKKVKRDLIQSTPKFYLFDVGVSNHLKHQKIEALQGSEAGEAFEHFILMELIAYCGLNEIDSAIHYWRSKSGLEVDFVLDKGKMAIEVKLSPSPRLSDLSGLAAFCEDYKPTNAIVVCQAPRKRLLKTKDGFSIEILPWREFLRNLWEGMY